MTSYFYDAERSELLAGWQTGDGGRAVRVCTLKGAAAGNSLGSDLASWLTGLSKAAWRPYTHGGGFVEADESNTEAWRLEQGREAFAEAISLIEAPGDPRFSSYSPILWFAQEIGTRLADSGGTALVAEIRHEVEAELSAVASAELGDFSDRAAQAVVLSRSAASPTQVQAAWDLLAGDPLDSMRQLETLVDPTSASVAAAAWLQGATEIAASAAGLTHWSDAIEDADDIEEMPVATCSAVLERLELGASPSEAVSGLVGKALRVADGRHPDRDGLLRQLVEAMESADELPDSEAAIFDQLRLCVLDPSRPGPDLLEDLISGIRGCYLLWHSHYPMSESMIELDGEDEDEENLAAIESAETAFEAEFAAALGEVMKGVDRMSL